jgi:nucleolar pre-ribosomal-associated protein 1
MFQEDAEEPSLWLASLPKTRRAIGAKSPDGAPLTDEGDSVLAFLDDCVQRCLKTPYRYVDDMNAMWTPESENVPEGSNLPIERCHSYPSPLLMTVLEQVAAKVAARLFSPSDILAITSFIRKLVFRLLTKQQDSKFLRAFTDKLDGGLQLDQLALSYPVVTAAIRREVSIIRYCLGDTRDIPFSQPNSANRASLAFLDHIEGQSLCQYYVPF